MAAMDFMIPMVRDMIGDNNSTVYSDLDLQQKILTAINIMQIEIDFNVDYVADMVGLTLTPDPYTSSPVDYDFMTLASLKTACMIERSEASRATDESVNEVQDNDFRIKIGGTAGRDKLNALGVNWCAAYEKAKDDFVMGQNSDSSGRAIISPFRYTDAYPPLERRRYWQ